MRLHKKSRKGFINKTYSRVLSHIDKRAEHTPLLKLCDNHIPKAKDWKCQSKPAAILSLIQNTVFNATLPEHSASAFTRPDNDLVLDAVAIEEGIKNITISASQDILLHLQCSKSLTEEQQN